MTETKESGFARRLEEFSRHVETMLGQMRRVIYGQDEVLRQLIAGIFARGHCLMVGVPGLAKTMMVSRLAEVMTLSFRRIQFTPDLMPSDITGTNVLDESTGRREFRFVPGPLFAHIVLGDEINRTPPKTQAALLQAMQERQVTSGQTTYDLPQPFFVIATQNPIEQEGTYPLPEAQLDRFMFKASVPYLNRQELNEVVNRTILGRQVQLDKVMDGDRILVLRRVLDNVVVADPIRDYAVRLVLATHPDGQASPEGIRRYVRWGASPRAAQALIRGGRVRALAEGRAHVSCDDVRHFADDVLQHRILLNYDGQAENVRVADLISQVLDHVPEEA